MNPVRQAPTCWLGVSVKRVAGVLRIWRNSRLACTTRRPVANGQYEPTPSLVRPLLSVMLGLE